MRPLRRLSVIDQTAAHIREGLLEGRWRGRLPGMRPLAAELDVSKDTVMAALRRLEEEGLLKNPGRSRRRAIAEDAGIVARGGLRVGLLEYEPFAATSGLLQRMMLRIEHDLEAVGHRPFFAARSLGELDHDPARVARLVSESPADAWVVLGGERRVLEWFAGRPVPTLAICGGVDGLPIASVTTDVAQALTDATRRLIALGHRRIVLVGPRHWRQPVAAKPVRRFTETMVSAGLACGAYNIPEWEETPEGYERLLESLFRLTPPTALIVPDAAQTVATMVFLAKRGLSVPGDVSLVTECSDQSFSWCREKPACFERDESLTVRQVSRWIGAVAAHKTEETRHVEFHAAFREGFTIGLAHAAARAATAHR